MKHFTVNSSWINSAEYSSYFQFLRLHLRTGKTLEYYNISSGLFYRFLSSSSKGKFYQVNIQGNGQFLYPIYRPKILKKTYRKKVNSNSNLIPFPVFYKPSLGI